MIEVERLTKTFGATRAITGMTFTVAPQSCLGIVGDDGSGKTTLLRILATLIAPSSGVVRIDGMDIVSDIDRVRPRIAFADGTLVPGDGWRISEYLAAASRARRRRGAAPGAFIAQALTRAGLDGDDDLDAIDDEGRSRLALAAALCAESEVLILDEPLRAIDRAARERFAHWIDERHTAGATIVVAAHALSELPACCHRTVRMGSGAA